MGMSEDTLSHCSNQTIRLLDRAHEQVHAQRHRGRIVGRGGPADPAPQFNTQARTAPGASDTTPAQLISLP